MDNSKVEKLFICDCHGEGILVRRDDEGEVYLSLWGYKSSKLPFMYRLKYCWRMLRNGTSVDEVVLSSGTALALGEELCKK